MQVNIVQTRSGSGFKIYGKIKDVIKNDGRDALLVEQISGQNTGREVIVVLKEDPNYKGVLFDEAGLIALKIKKGVNVGFSNCDYISKNNEAPPVIETRRAHKIGRDFRPEQSLVISSFAARVENLNGSVISPKEGVYGSIDGDRKSNLKELIAKVNLTDSEGLLIALNSTTNITKNIDGKDVIETIPVTLQANISRFHKDDAGSPARLLSSDEFASKVTNFLENGKFTSFDGRMNVDANAAFASTNDVKAAVIPSETIFLTGAKYFDKGRQSIQTGVGNVGVGIDTASEDRPYPIIQIGAMEMTGHLGMRGLGPNQEPYGGDKVRKDNADFIFTRLTGQIDLLNGITANFAQQEGRVARQDSKVAESQAEQPKVIVEQKPGKSEIGIEDEENLFSGFGENDEEDYQGARL